MHANGIVRSTARLNRERRSYLHPAKMLMENIKNALQYQVFEQLSVLERPKMLKEKRI